MQSLWPKELCTQSRKPFFFSSHWLLFASRTLDLPVDYLLAIFILQVKESEHHFASGNSFIIASVAHQGKLELNVSTKSAGPVCCQRKRLDSSHRAHSAGCIYVTAVQYGRNFLSGAPPWWEVTLEKTLMLGKIEGKRRRGQQRMKWLDGITNSVDISVSKLQ